MTCGLGQCCVNDVGDGLLSAVRVIVDSSTTLTDLRVQMNNGTKELRVVTAVGVPTPVHSIGEGNNLPTLGDVRDYIIGIIGLFAEIRAPYTGSTDAGVLTVHDYAESDIAGPAFVEMAGDQPCVDPDADPLTLLHDSLWEMLESETMFTEIIKPRNRIKFNSMVDRDTGKREIAANDVPEVRIIPTNWNPHLQRTSNTSTGWFEFQIQIATGDWRANKYTFPVMWSVWQAVSSWRDRIGSLTWKGQPFVLHLRPQESPIGTANIDLDRGILGWSTIWSCRVELKFTTTQLQTGGN